MVLKSFYRPTIGLGSPTIFDSFKTYVAVVARLTKFQRPLGSTFPAWTLSYWSSCKIGGIVPPACATCPVRWLRNRKRLPWKLASTCCKASSPRMTSCHSHSRSACFMRLSNSCLSSKVRWFVLPSIGEQTEADSPTSCHV